MRTLPNLPATIAREAYASLCGVLPPPAIDTPETRAARDDEAMAAVAILRPADAFEARLAVDVVTAEAHARDCLRLAAKYCNDVTTALRCRAQFAVMMRQMQSALRTLQRMQAARQDTDAASAPGDDQRPQPTSPGLDERQAIPDPAVPDTMATNTLDAVRQQLAAEEPELRRRGVCHLAVFGSVARGDDRPDGDVDVAVEIEADRSFSLIRMEETRLFLEDALRRRVDLGEVDSFRPQVRAAFERERVPIF